MAKVRRSKVDSLVEQIARLSEKELEELRRRMGEVGQTSKQLREPSHDIMELKGLGKEFWRTVDVQKYLEEERRSWE